MVALGPGRGWGGSVQASRAVRLCAFMSDVFSKTARAQPLLHTPSRICPWQPGGFVKSALGFSAQFLSAFPGYLGCSLSNVFQDLHLSAVSLRIPLNLAQSTVARPW